uniref:SAC domain-containing protein n=1 Tax=Branchiostoma floridae TaxID=7739 RepID=C3XZS0_BRAFL|eukprot:XP_002610458.1 hypothetical protein BRAFLDRAFT_85597 [Branchiostoma floridae]
MPIGSYNTLYTSTGEDLCNAWNPVCLGLVHGVIGKVQLYPDSEWHLLLVTKKMSVGVLPGGHEVYKISRVVILPLSPVEPPEMELEWCRKHHFGISNLEKIAAPLDSQQRALAKTWNSIKSVAVPKKKRDIKEKEKLERRVFEELNKMFSDSDSFYYSPTGDLTNSVQRQHSEQYDTTSPLWKKVDSRFFWNTHMLNDLIQSEVDSRFFWNTHMLNDLIQSEDPLSDRWIVPIIQGYVQMERFQVMLGEEDMPSDEGMEMTSEGRNFTITLISRRSRHRAGTRYKRRGVDETGACANFVETEQVRGSVPIFWSQPGIRYRPPPRIDRGEVETQAAFEKHFEEQFDTYGSQVVANLVDQVGREKVIGDAFLTHILNMDSTKLTYITFDFHEHCRGMKFENVCVLVDSIKDLIRGMRYSWVDPAGVICEQRGVFRTNCMDCLDRTNVVQSAIARTVMEIQLRKLGLMMPDQTMPSRCRVVYQQMWANNGDAISRQYAGTAAMKGDFTRTGERKLAGVLNDGYKSANRYYLSRFKDAYRQATIDMMLGNAVSEDLTVLQSSNREEELLLEEREDHVAQLIEHCKQLLLPGAEGCAGGWALIDCDPGSQLLEERLSQALEEEARADLSRLRPSTQTLSKTNAKAKSRSLNNLASNGEVVKETKTRAQEQEDGKTAQDKKDASALTQRSMLSTISQDALSGLRPPESLKKLQDVIKQQFSEVPSKLQKYVTVGQSEDTERTSQQNKDNSERDRQEGKDGPATCTTFGDPHYRTFDGKMIHFQGTCVYTLAADCDGGDFEVLVQNDDRGAFGAVSWTQESKIKLKGVEIELLQKWVVKVINPEMYFASCVYDLCACGSNDQCLCDALGAYAAECSAAGVVLNWRSPSMCAIGCPSERGLMFDECGPICPRTCANKHTVLGDVPTPCFKPCIPSCQCPAGQVLWDNQCVTPGQCPDTGLYNIFR